MKKLSKTQQAILAMFATKANEDGRVLVDGLRECAAAWKLADAGLVTVQVIEDHSHMTKSYNWGRDRDRIAYTTVTLGVRLVKGSN